MYELARRITPELYYRLALALYCEMAMAGITTVGEFHYLHRDSAGKAYDDPNEMGLVLKEAASEAGVRLTLLDTLYLTGGLSRSGHIELNDVQRRFSDESVEGWQERVSRLSEGDRFKIGRALHSVRAVPRLDLLRVGEQSPTGICHIHLSEQREENELCQAYYGCTPTELLSETGLLTSRTTLVHGTHTEPSDRELIERSRSGICLCPSTEADLADGLAPVSEFRDRGIGLSVGSDQHAYVDLFRELQLLEGGERLRTETRGHFSEVELMRIASQTGHEALGWGDVGRFEVGYQADFLEVALDSTANAGADPDQILFSASRSDVRTVVVGGAAVVVEGRHRHGDVGQMLARAINDIW
jgi:formiminoglutamate deiminase